MGTKKPACKVVQFRLNHKAYDFALRFGVLTLGVGVGVAILWLTHNHVEFGLAIGAARFAELAGEAGADALLDE